MAEMNQRTRTYIASSSRWVPSTAVAAGTTSAVSSARHLSPSLLDCEERVGSTKIWARRMSRPTLLFIERSANNDTVSTEYWSHRFHGKHVVEMAQDSGCKLGSLSFLPQTRSRNKQFSWLHIICGNCSLDNLVACIRIVLNIMG